MIEFCSKSNLMAFKLITILCDPFEFLVDEVMKDLYLLL